MSKCTKPSTTEAKPASTVEELQDQARLLRGEARRLCGKNPWVRIELLTAALALQIVQVIEDFEDEDKSDENRADIIIGDCLNNLASHIREVRQTGRLMSPNWRIRSEHDREAMGEADRRKRTNS
jgi:hypothetical protein